MNKHDKISLMTNPIVVMFILIIIFSFFSPIGTGDVSKIKSFLISTIFLVIIPSLIGFYYFKKGYIDINISNKEKRILMFNILAIVGIINLVIFYLLGVRILYILTVLYLIETIVLNSITRHWKISNHAFTITAAVTAIVYVFGIKYAPLYILTLLISYHRYKEKYHTAMQLIIGAILAVVITLMIFKMMW